MPTDDDRREVARRLREHSGVRLFTGEDVESLIGIELSGFRPKYADNSYNRLADLIDPGESGQNQDTNPDTVQKESPAVQKAPECDRDALLALADELDGLGSNGFSSGWSSGAVNVGSFARRIRKALGVDDG